MKRRFPQLAFFICMLASATMAQPVVINEIMYHPSSENVLEEYIELYNPANTNVSLANWQFDRGVNYLFPTSATISAGGYLVVVANTSVFSSKYPAVQNMVGGWTGILNNGAENIRLVNAAGETIDEVSYADSGDWGIRQRSPDDRGHRGWQWFAEHDGLGKSLELVNRLLPNQYGQNWVASATQQGTPGAINSTASANSSPLILDARHFPLVPSSSDQITISARLLDDFNPNITVELFYRVSVASPGPFSTVPMLDDGFNDDGAPADGIYAARLSPRAHNTVIEYYIRASDVNGRTRTWPAPAIELDLSDIGQAANALLQVDDTVYSGNQPLYKIIMTEAERAQLAAIPSQSTSYGPDSQMNATFISMDGSGADLRYLVGVRNRGHGSRRSNPPNYRVNFRDDEPWKDATAINLNTRQVHIQHLGSVLARRAGAAGPAVIPVQVRVNNQNLASSGAPMFGSYAAVEVVNADWAEIHFPEDSGGNVYKVVRDFPPPNFDYRGDDPNAYRNTYFKESNLSEDNWTDLIGMLRVMGENSGQMLTMDNIKSVINLDQWLSHLAVMNLFGNGESGVNTGNNDDYLMYAGVTDPRFNLIYWDLDQILGQGGSLSSSSDIFRSTCCPVSGDSEGIWRAMDRFLHHPEIEPLYYQELFTQLQETFSESEFNAIVDQTLGSYVPQNTLTQIKSWMASRRAYVDSVLPIKVTRPVVVISGEPKTPTWNRAATLSISGEGVTHYSYSLDGGEMSQEIAIGEPLQLSSLANGTHTVSVIGRNSAGIWQSVPTVVSWVVDATLPAVRINEVLAKNNGSYQVGQTFPDFIELFNEGTSSVDLSGMSLTDNTNFPVKYIFPAGTIIGSGGYLLLHANSATLGFALSEDGEEVALYDTVANNRRLLDRVVFGRQLADYSVSRFGAAGEWLLSSVTPGAANSAVPLGNEDGLKINEWLAGATSAFEHDFVEIYNSSSFPVDMGGLYFSDEPITQPNLFRVRPLTFVGSNSFIVFTASGAPQNIGHLNFSLAIEQGVIALLDEASRIIDYVNYGSQAVDVSEGRAPDGSTVFNKFVQPTPGTPNPGPIVPPEPARQIVFHYSGEWRYNQSGFALPAEWKEINYNETGFQDGEGLLGISRFQTPAFPEPLNTQLTFTQPRQITFYFRSDFLYFTNTDATAIEFRHIIDDGAVFYLNGREINRFNMPGGPIAYTTLASQNILDAEVQSFQISPTNLNNGANYLAVELHQNAQSSADVVMGLQISAILRAGAPVSTNIVINEFLAANSSITEADGSTPDWIELYNPANTSVDISGMRLSDDSTLPGKLVLGSGTVISAKGTYKIVLTNSFNLAETGGSVFLSASLDRGGTLLDSITYGLQVADFSLARVPDGTATWTLGVPSGGSRNIAAALGSSSNVRVNEWMADPVSGEDWFELYNPNPQPVDISRHHLTDNLSIRTNHQIRNYSYLGAGVTAHRQFFADGEPFAGADHVNFKLSASQEAIGFYSPTGVLIDAITYGQQTTGVSEGRLPDGASQIVLFAQTPTPGQSNYLPLTNVVINEILTHSDPPYEDAVEIYNTSASAVDISGWGLSDSTENLLKYVFPAGSTIPARGYLVVYEDSFLNGPGVSFAFSSADGDDVYLSQIVSNAPTGYRAFASFGPAENGVSFGRFQTSAGVEFVPMASRTFGVNTPQTVEQFRTGTGATNSYAKVGPVVINEIMYRPVPDGTNDNVVEEFVELFNLSQSAIRLYDLNHPTNTWRLRGGIDFNFPPNITLTAGSHVLLVSFDPSTNAAALAQFRGAYGTNLHLVGPYSGKLDNGGEEIRLLKPDSPQLNGSVPYILVERVAYDDVTPWPTGADGTGLSLQRISSAVFGNEPTNWHAATPSPGPAGTPGFLDTDGDGMSDEWELANDFDPSDPADALLDTDSDRASNYLEFVAGTDPRSASSVLAFTSFQAQPGNQFQLSFMAVAGKTYSVQRANELRNPDWTTITNVAPGVTGTVVVTDVPGAGNEKYYRIVTPALQ